MICTRCQTREARHNVQFQGIPLGAFLCCEDMDAAMVEVGEGQPDYEEGLALFRRHHETECGYVVSK